MNPFINNIITIPKYNIFESSSSDILLTSGPKVPAGQIYIEPTDMEIIKNIIEQDDPKPDMELMEKEIGNITKSAGPMGLEIASIRASNRIYEKIEDLTKEIINNPTEDKIIYRRELFKILSFLDRFIGLPVSKQLLNKVIEKHQQEVQQPEVQQPEVQLPPEELLKTVEEIQLNEPSKSPKPITFYKKQIDMDYIKFEYDKANDETLEEFIKDFDKVKLLKNPTKKQKQELIKNIEESNIIEDKNKLNIIKKIINVSKVNKKLIIGSILGVLGITATVPSTLGFIISTSLLLNKEENKKKK